MPPQTIPRGHPDAFTNKTFVITGVLDSLTRQDAEDLVKRHGGKVTQAVSGRTRFLVAGNLGGSSKARGAKDYGTQVRCGHAEVNLLQRRWVW